MKALWILIIILAAAMMGDETRNVYAETRTLTTTIVITMKAPAPAAVGVPQGVQRTLGGSLQASRNEQFIKLDNTVRGMTGTPCYTMMEKL